MFETYELMKQVCFHHAFFGSRLFIYIYKVHIRVYMSEHDTYTIRLFGEITTFFLAAVGTQVSVGPRCDCN